MTTTLIIAARELRERRFVFAAALILATMPFLMALLPFSQRYGVAASIAGSGPALAAVFGVAIAVGLGISMVTRELADHRLSFYFARPVSAAALWFGKLIATLVITALCFAIIAVPSIIAGREAWHVTWGTDALTLTATVLAAAAFLIVLSHALSTMIRSRSALLALDLLLVAAFGFAAALMILPLIESMAVRLAATVAALIAAALFVALVAAGAWQISRGRTEIRRSHREMSKFLWASLASAMLLIAGYVVWVFSVDPRDLRIALVEPSSRGDWAAVGGTSAGRGDYFPVFLIGPDEQFVKFPAGRWSVPEFSRAGNAVYGELAPVRFIGPAPGGVVTMYRFGIDQEPFAIDVDRTGRVVLSDDGRRMAIINDRTVSIQDIDGDRLLASAPAPKADRVTGFFAAPDVLRLIATDDESLSIFELSTATKKLTRTGHRAVAVKRITVQASGDGSMLLARYYGDEMKQVFVLDGRTGALRASLPEVTSPFASTFLQDGRIALLTGDQDRALKLFNPDGTLQHELPLGRAERARISGETAAGQLVVAMADKPFTTAGRPGEWNAVVVDLARGAVTRRDESILITTSWWSNDLRVPLPNVTGEFIARDADGNLWRWNASTGQKEKFI